MVMMVLPLVKTQPQNDQANNEWEDGHWAFQPAPAPNQAQQEGIMQVDGQPAPQENIEAQSSVTVSFPSSDGANSAAGPPLQQPTK